MTKLTKAALPLAITLGLIPTVLRAQPASVAADEQLATVVVTETKAVGKASLSTAVEALPTPVTVLDRETIESLPVTRTTDLLRSTPGVSFGSSSPGGDLGDDISIRGFSSFHGGDVAVFVDGVPVNTPNHTNRHGAADFNWLIPELIERIEIIKGPFSALYGNFNLSGAINIITKDKAPTSVGIGAGSYGQYRGTGTFSGDYQGITPFIAGEVLDRDGYRDHQGYRRVNLFNKIGLPLPGGKLNLRFNASLRDAETAGFLLAEDVREGRVDRRRAAPGTGSDGISNNYYTLVANYIPTLDTGLTVTGYAGRDEYDQRDTSFGAPQTISSTARDYAGYRVQKSLAWPGRALLTVGSDGQLDNGQYQSADGDGTGQIVPGSFGRDQAVESLQTGLYAQAQYKLLEPLKLVGGLRFDRLRNDVRNHLQPNSGVATQQALSPKIGVVYTPVAAFEVFSNYGRGFRSPTATELSPNRSGAAFASKLDVAKLSSADLGVTLRPLPGLKLSGDVYTTETRRELRRDPANPLNVINIGETERKGYELVAAWTIASDLDLIASHAGVSTHIKQPANPAEDRVITVPDNVQTLMLAWSQRLDGLPFAADLFAERVGPRPLAADGSVEARQLYTYGAKARLSRGPVSGFVQLSYRPDTDNSDFSYDLGDGPIIDPAPRLDLFAGVNYRFD